MYERCDVMYSLRPLLFYFILAPATRFGLQIDFNIINCPGANRSIETMYTLLKQQHCPHVCYTLPYHSMLLSIATYYGNVVGHT